MTRAVPTCARCGATGPAPDPGAGPDASAAPPLGWSSGVERGRSLLFCPDCTRAHVRSIEARLDSEWW